MDGKHGITARADALFEKARDEAFDMLVIPGGTVEYTKHEGLLDLVRRYDICPSEYLWRFKMKLN